MWFLSFVALVLMSVCPCDASQPSFDVVIQGFADSPCGFITVVVREDAECFLSDGPNGLRRSAYTALLDQALEGYRFLPEIDVQKGGPELLYPEVRRHVCEKVSFFSEALEHCFADLASFVVREKLTDISAQTLYNYFFPSGKTRQWSLIPKAEVGPMFLQDRVFISFSQEDMALKGVLCNRKNMSKKTRHQSLLDFKRWWEHPYRGGLSSRVNAPRLPSDAFCLEVDSCPSGCGVGVVLCLPDGRQKRDLFDVSGRYEAKKEWPGVSAIVNLPCFSSWRARLFDTFVLKCPVKGLVDAELFFTPGVRDAVCDKVSFPSKPFVDHLFDLIANCKRRKSALAEGELQAEDIWQLCGSCGALEMTSVERDAFLCGFRDGEKKSPRNCIFVLLQNEGVVLRGDALAQRNCQGKRNLSRQVPGTLAYFFWRQLSYSGYRATLTQGVRYVKGDEDGVLRNLESHKYPVKPLRRSNARTMAQIWEKVQFNPKSRR